MLGEPSFRGFNITICQSDSIDWFTHSTRRASSNEKKTILVYTQISVIPAKCKDAPSHENKDLLVHTTFTRKGTVASMKELKTDVDTNQLRHIFYVVLIIIVAGSNTTRTESYQPTSSRLHTILTNYDVLLSNKNVAKVSYYYPNERIGLYGFAMGEGDRLVLDQLLMHWVDEIFKCRQIMAIIGCSLVLAKTDKFERFDA